MGRLAQTLAITNTEFEDEHNTETEACERSEVFWCLRLLSPEATRLLGGLEKLVRYLRFAQWRKAPVQFNSLPRGARQGVYLQHWRALAVREKP